MKKTWVRAKPASIPKATQYALQARLEKHAQKHWAKQCREVVVRFRGAFAYVDAFPCEHQFMPGTTREQRERIEATPTHLCRLRYLGSDDAWEYVCILPTSIRASSHVASCLTGAELT